MSHVISLKQTFPKLILDVEEGKRVQENKSKESKEIYEEGRIRLVIKSTETIGENLVPES